MTRPVVTRFAPSPTGYLHIGGARTTLFNWLYAKHTGGTFRLRIEDTDRERSTPAATQAIVSGLLWLGLDWDGEVVHQFARAARHAEVAHELLARGNAYYCYLSPAELEAMRKQAEAAKESVPIRSPWRDRDPSEAPPGIKPVIRLKAPRHGETVIEDRVQGRVVLQNELLDDFIILRSDGSPIYNLAVVVDDHDMGVTHVIRGVEHLTNAARQMLICQAMGWEVPVFAHVPLIHGADGAKLSKRHGALGVEEYQRMGYLPAALRNYLARLGWSHGDDEIFTTEQMIAWFDIDGLGKSPARFDFVKLADVNGHYIRATPDGELLGHLQACLAAIGTLGALTAEADPKAAPRPDLALLRQANAVRPDIASGGDLLAAFEAAGFDRLGAALPSLKTRAKTLADLAAGALYLLSRRPIVPDAKARSLLDGDARAAFAELAPRLGGLADWSAAAIEAEVRVFAEAKGWKLGKIAQPLRVALTGLSVSPPVFDVMAVLGREEALARLADQAGEQA